MAEGLTTWYHDPAAVCGLMPVLDDRSSLNPAEFILE